MRNNIVKRNGDSNKNNSKQKAISCEPLNGRFKCWLQAHAVALTGLLLAGGVISYLVECWQFGRWYWAFGGLLVWWVPSSIASALFAQSAVKSSHDHGKMLAIFYRTELFKWLGTLLMLVMAFCHGHAGLDLLFGYVAAIFIWIVTNGWQQMHENACKVSVQQAVHGSDESK